MLGDAWLRSRHNTFLNGKTKILHFGTSQDINISDWLSTKRKKYLFWTSCALTKFLLSLLQILFYPLIMLPSNLVSQREFQHYKDIIMEKCCNKFCLSLKVANPSGTLDKSVSIVMSCREEIKFKDNREVRAHLTPIISSFCKEIDMKANRWVNLNISIGSGILPIKFIT